MNDRELSPKQIERQKRHNRERNGRYAKMSHCEDCGKFVGDDYWSLEDCNKTGKGVCLCKSCYDKKSNTTQNPAVELNENKTRVKVTKQRFCPLCRNWFIWGSGFSKHYCCKKYPSLRMEFGWELAEKLHGKEFVAESRRIMIETQIQEGYQKKLIGER